MNYIEIDTIEYKKIIRDYHQVLTDHSYSKINPNIQELEWILFKKENLGMLKKYTYLDGLLSEIGYDKIDNVTIIKLEKNSEFTFNREGTYKKNYRVYEVPIMGGEKIEYCNDGKKKYSLEWNKLYLINAEKKLKILNHTNKDYINITITIKNEIQHLNIVNSSVPAIINKFYSHLHFNKDMYLDQPGYGNFLFSYKKLNETCIKKSENFISICATNNIYSLLNNLKSEGNKQDVYIWIYKGLNIEIETLEDNFFNSKFNIYYNIAPVDSYKWGALINVYLFKKYYNAVLLIKDEVIISNLAIEKIFQMTHSCKIICAYGFNFNDRKYFNNKTLIYNDLVDYASLDFATIPIDLISDDFFEWALSIKNYISKMEYIVNVYSVTEKKCTLISYDLNIKFKVRIVLTKLEMNYINSCYKYFIKNYNYPFKYSMQNNPEVIYTVSHIIITVILRNNVTVDNLKKCLDSIENQNYENLKVCIINDRFWGDYDIINALVDYIQLDDWYYIDNTFNLGTFMSIQVALELLNAEDNDIIINVEPYLELLNKNIIFKIANSFITNNIKILLGNISYENLSIFNYELIRWPDDMDTAFNMFLNKSVCDELIHPVINKKLIDTNPFKYMLSFSYKYFKYVSREDFHNNFILEMLNQSNSYIEIFCKPLSKSLVLDNNRLPKTDYKKGRLNYSKFILKDTLVSATDVNIKFSRRKYVYEKLCKKSKTLYIIFASDSKWNTIKHLLPILKHINCNVILLKDKNNYFLEGIPNLSNSVDFTIEYLRKVIRSTKSTVVKTYGINDGAFAAIYYGIVCNVNSIIVKNPHIEIDNRSRDWKIKIAQHNTTKVFFNLKNIRSRIPVKCIITKKGQHIPNSLNIELFKEPHIDLGYFVKDIFSPI